MQPRTLRSSLIIIHKWLGLHTAIFFSLMFLSGVILMFTDELEAAFHNDIWATAPADDQRASFGDIYDSVTQNFPQGTVYVVQKQPRKWLADRTYMTTGWGERVVVWSHPETAEILEVTKDVNFRTVLRQLHDSLLIPRRYGFVFVSATSLILLSSLITGLVIYRRFWKGFFRFSSLRNAGREYHGRLHRLLAVWVAVFLLLNAITGTYFLTTGLGMNGFTPNPEPAQTRQAMRPPGFDGALIDTAELAAHTALSQFSPTTMIAPGRSKDGIRFAGYTVETGQFSGSTNVSVDPTNMAVLGVNGPKNRSGNIRLRPLMDSIHFGEWGGGISRIIWIILGLASFYVVLSGVQIHLARTNSPNDQRGGIRRFIGCLGIYKWGHLAAVLLVAGLAATQFGPLATRWVTIAPVSAGSQPTRLQIFGPMREGKEMQLTLSVDSDKTQFVNIGSDNLAEKTLEYIPLEQGGTLAFQAVSAASGNVFVVTLTGENGETEVATFNLGSAIW